MSSMTRSLRAAGRRLRGSERVSPTGRPEGGQMSASANIVRSTASVGDHVY